MNGLKGWWRLSLKSLLWFQCLQSMFVSTFAKFVDTEFFKDLLSCLFEWGCIPFVVWKIKFSSKARSCNTAPECISKSLRTESKNKIYPLRSVGRWSLRTCQPMNFLSPIPPLITHVTKSHLAVALVGPVISKTSAWRLPLELCWSIPAPRPLLQPC